jgi:hypothetical protein
LSGLLEIASAQCPLSEETAGEGIALIDRIKRALEKARADNHGPRGHTLNEVEAALNVIDSLHAIIDATEAFETYCDVGSPDDCDHCHLLCAMHEWAGIVLGDEPEKEPTP